MEGKRLGSIPTGHTEPITSIAFNNDGVDDALLVTNTGDNVLHTFNLSIWFNRELVCGNRVRLVDEAKEIFVTNEKQKIAEQRGDDDISDEGILIIIFCIFISCNYLKWSNGYYVYFHDNLFIIFFTSRPFIYIYIYVIKIRR